MPPRRSPRQAPPALTLPAPALAKPQGQPVRPMSEMKEIIQRDHEAAVKAHFAEPVDPQWAPKATTSMSEDLGELGQELGVKVREVDCRSRTCVAALEWSDREAAATTYADFLHHEYAINCARAVVIPDSCQDGPCTAQMLFRCGNRK